MNSILKYFFYFFARRKLKIISIEKFDVIFDKEWVWDFDGEMGFGSSSATIETISNYIKILTK